MPINDRQSLKVMGFDAPRTFGLNCRSEILNEHPSDDPHDLDLGKVSPCDSIGKPQTQMCAAHKAV